MVRRAHTARAYSVPRLWQDLLAYHALSANVAGQGIPTIDILNVFSQFDGDSFPCTLPDPVYGRNQLAIAKRKPEEKALAGRICKGSVGFAYMLVARRRSARLFPSAMDRCAAFCRFQSQARHPPGVWA